MFWLIRSFVVPLIWATIFAISNWPLYRLASRHLPDALKSHVLPLVFSVLITLLVLGPVLFAFGVLAGQGHEWLNEIAVLDKQGLAAPSWLGEIPVLGSRLSDSWNNTAGVPGGLSSLLDRAESGSLLRSVKSIGRLIAYHAFVVAMTVVTLFSLFRQGESLAESLANRILERFGQPGVRYVGIAVATLRATLHSMILVGLTDGVVLGIAYAALRIPSPVAWGAVTGILAMLPFMGYFAVAAVCVSELAHHATSSAILIAVLGFLVLFLGDKFVRPVLMASEARLNFLGALIGTLGGLQTFGLPGLFIGPVIVALGEAICREWLARSWRVPTQREAA